MGYNNTRKEKNKSKLIPEDSFFSSPGGEYMNTAENFGITVLGSGSSGNASVIHGPQGCLLLDAGFSAKELERRLTASRIEPSSIRGILITHGHSDHIGGCRVFADRYKIGAYCTAPTLQEGKRSRFLPEKQFVIAPGTAFELCGIRIEPFTLPHDAVDTVGYTFSACGHKIGVATDLGHLTMLSAQKLRGCSVLMLESNHEPSMVHNCARPIQTKRRILGRHGHLSNTDAMAALQMLLTEKSRNVILAHLSSECNDRGLVQNIAEDTLHNLGRNDIALDIARQDAALPGCFIP